jgi:monothiol glutaredoxin
MQLPLPPQRYINWKAIMTRSVLDEAHIHPAIRQAITDSHADIVREVQDAIASNKVVVVGMTQNPFPRKARKALDAISAPYKYLEYGSYLGQWKRRNALKMWTGWPTFPMIFVNGTLVGGANDLQRLIDSDEFARMVAG